MPLPGVTVGRSLGDPELQGAARRWSRLREKKCSSRCGCTSGLSALLSCQG